MTITDWVDARVKVAATAVADAVMAHFDEKLGDLEANVGAMFTTVSKDVEGVANTISGDIKSVADGLSGDINGVAGALTKSTEDTIDGVGKAIAGIPQQIIDRLPHIPGF